jgi:hypothetical protein
LDRFVSVLATLAIISAPAVVAAAATVAPDATTSAITSATTALSSAAGSATRTLTRSSAQSQTTTTATGLASTTAVSTTGNGAPSGTHYNLNIIGVPKDKTADMTNNDGHRIFVQLTGGEDAGALTGKDFSQLNKVNKIFLQPAPAGESFQVLDANATDTNGALFQLPADVSTSWTVWARALGKPGGSSNTTTCATVTVTDPVTLVTTQEAICSVATLTMTRTKGKQSFTNVSADLLFLSIMVDPTTNLALATCLGVTTATQVTVSLFNGCLQNFFWNYQNNGLKLLQLRFYPTGAVLPGP